MLLERPAADSSKWRLRCLSNAAGGRPVSYANDLTIDSAGRIYFSDSSTIPPALNQAAPRPWYDTLRSFMLTLWHGGPTGRLLCYDPSTDATTVLADGLWYANGVALAADESFVAVVETCSMRVRRHWLKGPKAGSMDTLIDRLPGWPDNIVESSNGGFWLCLVLPDMPLVHKVLPQPWLRSLVAKLPERLLPPKPQWGCVLRLSAQGEVVQALTDPDGRHVSHISSVTEHADKLFIGNLAKDYVSVLDLRAVEEPH
ncbi:Adipocyte plasma membrane-associated protein [Chlorella vulgaris]